MKRQLIALVMMCALFISSCTTISFYADDLEQPASVSSSGSTLKYEVIDSFKINDKAGHLLGIIPVNQPAGDHHTHLSSLLSEQIAKAGGDAVINLKIRAQFQFTDYLVNLVTLGFYLTRTVTVTGDIIKYVE